MAKNRQTPKLKTFTIVGFYTEADFFVLPTFIVKITGAVSIPPTSIPLKWCRV